MLQLDTEKRRLVLVVREREAGARTVRRTIPLYIQAVWGLGRIHRSIKVIPKDDQKRGHGLSSGVNEEQRENRRGRRSQVEAPSCCQMIGLPFRLQMTAKHKLQFPIQYR